MNNKQNHLITIITVVYNCVNTLEETILSVINQDCDDFEYIIVDGGSNDGTVEIIKKYQDKITLWISEPDNGIYDAMNKSLNYVNGNWCYYLNSGDSFYSGDVLSNVIPYLNDDIDVVYGSINCITRTNSFVKKPSSIGKILEKMVFCHQAVFVKKEILKKFKFNVNYKIAADFDLFRKLYIKNFIFFEIEIVIANYDAFTGISSKNIIEMEKEYYIITEKWDSFKYKVKFLLKVFYFQFYKLYRYIFFKNI